MKANELMIGDWICGSHNETNAPRPNWGWHKTRVNDILKVCYMSFGLHSIECCGYECGCVSLKEEEISPLPLTPEILEKNGFSDRDKAGWQNPDYDATYYLDGYMFSKNVYKHTLDDSVLVDVIHGIKYVHELQHALRLCGLNNLADNFKV